MARARGKGALLRACAFVALATNPAIGLPPLATGAAIAAPRPEFEIADLAKARAVAVRLGSTSASMGVRVPLASNSEIILNQGAFDIAVARTVAEKASAVLAHVSASRPMPGGVQLAQLLLERGAAPVVNTATFMGGVITLSSGAPPLADHPVTPPSPPPPTPHHPPPAPPPPPPPHHDPPPAPPPPHHDPPPAPPPPPPPPSSNDRSLEFFLPWPPQPDDADDKDGDVLQLALDDGFVSEGITSGSDPSVWEPIDADKKPGGP